MIAKKCSLVTTGSANVSWQARNFDNLLSVHTYRQEHNYPVSRILQTTSRLVTNGRTCLDKTKQDAQMRDLPKSSREMLKLACSQRQPLNY